MRRLFCVLSIYALAFTLSACDGATENETAYAVLSEYEVQFQESIIEIVKETVLGQLASPETATFSTTTRQSTASEFNEFRMVSGQVTAQNTIGEIVEMEFRVGVNIDTMSAVSVNLD